MTQAFPSALIDISGFEPVVVPVPATSKIAVHPPEPIVVVAAEAGEATKPATATNEDASNAPTSGRRILAIVFT
jgi:hypothetical protein